MTELAAWFNIREQVSHTLARAFGAKVTAGNRNYKESERTVATDYDNARGRADDELEADSLEGLKAAEDQASSIDEDGEIVDTFVPPTPDLSGEELNVSVVPRRSNEFTCSVCFLVQKNNRLSYYEADGSPVCKDCA